MRFKVSQGNRIEFNVQHFNIEQVNKFGRPTFCSGNYLQVNLGREILKASFFQFEPSKLDTSSIIKNSQGLKDKTIPADGRVCNDVGIPSKFIVICKRTKAINTKE